MIKSSSEKVWLNKQFYSDICVKIKSEIWAQAIKWGYYETSAGLLMFYILT